VTLVRNANACVPIRAMSGFLATYKLDLLTPPNKKTTYSRRELFKYAWAPFFTNGLAIPGVYLITDISFQRHRKQCQEQDEWGQYRLWKQTLTQSTSVGEFFHIENTIYGSSWSKTREPAKKWTPWIMTNWFAPTSIPEFNLNRNLNVVIPGLVTFFSDMTTNLGHVFLKLSSLLNCKYIDQI